MNFFPCEWLRTAFEKADDEFLVGNHCFAYLSYELGVRWGFCSCWTAEKQHVFHEYFPGDLLLQRCRWFLWWQGWLISHAGLSSELYMSFSKQKLKDEVANLINDAENALTAGIAHPAFLAGRDRGGPQKVGGIPWCDWNRFSPVPGIRQITWHTPAGEVRYKKGDVCLDTHLRHYGLVENGELTVLEPYKR